MPSRGRVNERLGGYFHIVSRDTGFDALVLHLKEKKILARRDESFASSFGVAAKNLPAPENRLRLVIDRLTKNKKNRPARRKTLLSQINAYFGKMLSETEVSGILDALVAANVIHLTPRGGVDYKV